MRRWLLWFALGISSVVLAGCGDDDDSSPFSEVTVDPTFEEAPRSESEFVSWFGYDPLAGCSVPNPQDLNLRTEIRAFRGSGVSDDDIRTFLGGLQRYYDQYGIQMFMRHAPIEVPIGQALILDPLALSARVKADTGIDINRVDPNTLSEEEYAAVQRSIGYAVMHNLREFMAAYGSPRQRVVNVVVLGEMAGAQLQGELESFEGILGLGLSPELLATFPPEDPAAQLYDWFGLGEEFTPTAIVGAGPTERFSVLADIVIAHELGHAYGLTHVLEEGNLLHQGEINCQLALDDTQLAMVSAATAELSHQVDIESHSLTSRAGEFVEALESWPWRR